MLLGLTRGATKAHIARAALEGIAYQVTDVLRAMESDAEMKIKEIRVDGGAVVNNLLMQFQADMIGVPVVRPHMTELTALGAAFLAGLSVGMWKDMQEIAHYWKEDKRFSPIMDEKTANLCKEKWKKAVTLARTWEEK
jgi:glycerol kinase